MGREQFLDQESQGGIRDFEFTVTKSYFEEVDMSTPERAVAPVLMLHWEGTTNLDDRPILGGTDFHPSYSLGKGWATLDGGKTIKNPSKNAKLGSWYGRLATQVAQLTASIADTPDDPTAPAEATPDRADMWLGTTWHMDEVDYDFGKLGKQGKLMPTRFISWAKGIPQATAPATATPVENGQTTFNGGGVRDALTALARSASSYPEFQASALRVDGVTKDSALLDEVLDEARFFTKARS